MSRKSSSTGNLPYIVDHFLIMLNLKGNIPMQIKAEPDAVYRNSGPSFVTVKIWAPMTLEKFTKYY